MKKRHRHNETKNKIEKLRDVKIIPVVISINWKVNKESIKLNKGIKNETNNVK